MAKHSVIDLKQTKNSVAPISQYARLKFHGDDKFRMLLPDGTIHYTTEPLLPQCKSYVVSDPSLLTPALWDSYIIPLNALNDWSTHINEYTLWNGTDWEYLTPEVGFITYNNDIENMMKFNGAEWVIMVPETEIHADNITIESNHGFDKHSTEQTIGEIISNNWMHGVDTNDSNYVTQSCDENGGLAAIAEFWRIWRYDNVPIPSSWDAGTYEFYSTVDLVPGNIALKDYNTGNLYYFTSIYENGLYRHSTVLNGGEDIRDCVQDDVLATESGVIWLIDRYNTDPINDEITIKNIDKIIAADGTSIDTAAAQTNAKAELITRDYVDKNISSSDDITISDYRAAPTVSTEPNISNIFVDSWDANAPINWTEGSTDVTFSNGVLHVTQSNNFHLLTTSEIKKWKGGFYRFVTDLDFAGNNITLLLHSNSGTWSKHYDQVQLASGEYELKMYIPEAFKFYILSINYNGATVPPFYLKFVVKELYPPKKVTKVKNIDYIIDDDGESIDGSDTPMIDPHRELVTRAYVESITAQSVDILYADLVTDISNSALSSGTYYRITDYTHSNYQESTETVIYSIVHPIIVQANNPNTLNITAIDPVYTDDVINYSIDNIGPSTTGTIIYRNDLKRNIKGNSDWRLTRYERWSCDTGNTTYTSTDYSLLSENSIHNGVGYNQDGTLISLSPISSTGLYPVINDLSTYAKNVEMIDTFYTIFDTDTSQHGPNDVYLKNVLNSTIIYRGGTDRVDNLKLNSVKNLFLPKGASFLTINSTGFISFDILLFGIISNVSFDRCQGICTDTMTNCTFHGPISKLIANGSITNNTISTQVSTQISCAGDFSNNIINANTINLRTDLSTPSNITSNNITTAGTIKTYGTGDFNNNNITNNEFDNILHNTFSKNTISADYSNISFNNVTDSVLTGSLESPGFPSPNYDETSFDIDNTTSLADTSLDGTVLLDLDNTYLLDSTAGPFSLELPPVPYEGLTIRFIDQTNQCFINNFTVTVSSNPDVGTVNTINGVNSWDIKTNYGILELLYDTTSGWLVQRETTLNSEVDDITIEEAPAHMNTTVNATAGTSTGNWLSNAFAPIADESNWSMSWGTFDNNNEFTSADDTGVHYIDIGRDKFDTFDIWDIGVHYFYSTAQIDAGNGGVIYLRSTDAGNLGTDYTWDGIADGSEVINSVLYYKYKFNIIDTGTDQDRQIRFIEIYPSDLQNTEFKVKQFVSSTTFIPPEHSIKEIDYIIDDDDQSIDGSDTPMSDPHRELVTRAKVEQTVAALSPWAVNLKDIDGDGSVDEKEITPNDPLVKQVAITENTRGFTGFYVQNSGNETNNDNYSGSNIVLTGSSTAFDSQVYIAYHGSDFYDAYLQDRAAIMTDSSMIIGAYNSTDKQGAPAFVSFVVGDDYNNQKEIYKLTTNGLEMTLPDKKIFYESGKTPIADPASYTDLRCNTVTGEIYAASGSAALTDTTERFTIAAADVANGYITIANIPNASKHMFVIHNGLILDQDPSADFTISGGQINFLTPIEIGDKVLVKYSF